MTDHVPTDRPSGPSDNQADVPTNQPSVPSDDQPTDLLGDSLGDLRGEPAADRQGEQPVGAGAPSPADASPPASPTASQPQPEPYVPHGGPQDWRNSQPRPTFPVHIDPEIRRYQARAASRDEMDRGKTSRGGMGSQGEAGYPCSDVGYGRPPAEHRFAPGQSGNPAGRPKGSKNKPPGFLDDRLGDLLLREAYREVTVTVAGEPLTLSMIDLGVRAVVARAAKGHVPATRFMVEHVGRVEAQRGREAEATFREVATYKIWAMHEIKERERQGIFDHPDIVPHPDDVVVEPRGLEARIDGPLSVTERDAFHDKLTLREELQETIAFVAEKIKKARDPERQALLRGTIERVEAQIAELDATLPEGWTDRRRPRPD